MSDETTARINEQALKVLHQMLGRVSDAERCLMVTNFSRLGLEHYYALMDILANHELAVKLFEYNTVVYWIKEGAKVVPSSHAINLELPAHMEPQQ